MRGKKARAIRKALVATGTSRKAYKRMKQTLKFTPCGKVKAVVGEIKQMLKNRR